jgi:hypothetical protein
VALNISTHPGPVIARHSGKVIDVKDFSQDRGAPIIQWAKHQGPNQRFRLQPIGGGFYRIVAKHSGKVLDVFGASRDNGAAIIQ